MTPPTPHHARVDLIGLLDHEPNFYLNQRGRPMMRGTLRVERGPRPTLVSVVASDERVIRAFAAMPRWSEVAVVGFLVTDGGGRLAVHVDGFGDEPPAPMDAKAVQR